ncbi:ABC transporter ATP-binding protein [Alkalihalobacterium bogoriense]|uniref:ABC transporter ATP-binding protein n=1 Tax=Alkalihalobacterium bogoriense TaxID=246272 RepID=UPI00047AE7A3|nr:ABC transporter ATP-binding protein [Alkalihalobacterium bogoriense]
MIEAVTLTKQFKGKTVVDSIQLSIEKGEVVGLLGPNGAGKSTTISMLSTLLTPTRGQVLLDGIDVQEDLFAFRKTLGVVPQELALYEEISGLENLLFFAKLHNLPANQRKEKTKEVLKAIGLDGRENDVVRHYSGGMKRRLNIGIALLHDPNYIYMDEPTVGIDPQSRKYILDFIKSYCQTNEVGLLYTSHYMDEVEYLCDRIYIMDHGKLIASGTKQELTAILASEETVEMTVEEASPSFYEALQADTRLSKVTQTGKTYVCLMEKDAISLSELFELASKLKTKIRSVDVKKPTLEDVFLYLTGKTLRD